jgi:alkylation response protein AidB-like acyl-CoA dehydrogenase
MHADFSPEALPVQQDRRRFVAENDPADLHGKQGEDGALLKAGLRVWYKLLAKKGRVSAAWPVEDGRSHNDTGQHQGINFRLMDVKSPGVTVRPIITLGGEHRGREVSLEGVCVPVGNRVYERKTRDGHAPGSCWHPNAPAEPGGKRIEVAVTLPYQDVRTGVEFLKNAEVSDAGCRAFFTTHPINYRRF